MQPLGRWRYLIGIPNGEFPMLKTTALTFVGMLLSAPAFAPVGSGPHVQDDWCREHDRDRGWFCEEREVAVTGSMDPVRVDARPNGAITVEGWDRNSMRVVARVSARADSDDEARDLARQVEVTATDGTVRSRGPSTRRGASWSVSYRLWVPRESNLDLDSENGGVGIDGVTGRIRFNTTNGGVRLDGVGGDVRGETTNGGIDVRLAGQEWAGAGLDVQTTNGGVRLTVPSGYNARLETGTVNGGFRIDFPITVQGRVGREIMTDLGRGGKLVRVRTTNGGVVIARN